MAKAFALILAGGVGTRLWPRSRRAHPKQLIELVSSQTLLERTYQRIVPLIPPERIYVATGAEYRGLVQSQLPELPPENIIGEPAGRNTAPCIGLAARYMAREDQQAVMVSLHGDHVIGKEEEFRELVATAVETAERGHIVTLGIVPGYPETGYGYIHRGGYLATVRGRKVFRVLSFTEKPDAPTARQFLESGDYFWNSGMFIWRLEVLQEAFRRHLPRLTGQLDQVAEAIGTAQESAVLRAVWAGVEDKSIDHGIMEKAKDVAVIPADIGWSDVGSWTAIRELLPHDSQGNTIVGAHLGLDTADCLIHGSGRLIATIGLRGMVIVDTEDALLICPQERAQEVKKLVELLRERGEEGYL